MRQSDKVKTSCCSGTWVTGWSKIPLRRTEDNLGLLLVLSSSNSIPLMASVSFVLREENYIVWRIKILDGLYHFPKDIIPNCMLLLLRANLIIIYLGGIFMWWYLSIQIIAGAEGVVQWWCTCLACMKPQTLSPAHSKNCVWKQKTNFASLLSRS